MPVNTKIPTNAQLVRKLRAEVKQLVGERDLARFWLSQMLKVFANEGLGPKQYEIYQAAKAVLPKEMRP